MLLLHGMNMTLYVHTRRQELQENSSDVLRLVVPSAVSPMNVRSLASKKVSLWTDCAKISM